jgi:prepilin-type N-terminal cleavage/methylation domain-containing protein
MKLKAFSQKAFTLVEIMIVVAIIGMLAAIAIPNYAKSRETAHKVTCISNLQHIDGAIQLWAMEQKKDADQVVTYTDISGYLRNSVSCPSGGTSFADSYTITTVDAKPTCQRKAEAHKLPF